MGLCNMVADWANQGDASKIKNVKANKKQIKTAADKMKITKSDEKRYKPLGG